MCSLLKCCYIVSKKLFVCLFVCLDDFFPRNETNISFSYDSSSNWLEYVLYSVFDIFWKGEKKLPVNCAATLLVLQLPVCILKKIFTVCF